MNTVMGGIEKMSEYWERVCDMQKKQTEKGLNKYGQILEENTKMNPIQRLEYLEEELVDALMYIEHLKVVLSEEKEVPVLLNGKFVVTKYDTMPHIVGEILEVKNGRFQMAGNEYPFDEPLTDWEDLKRYASGEECRLNGKHGSFSEMEFIVIKE